MSATGSTPTPPLLDRHAAITVDDNAEPSPTGRLRRRPSIASHTTINVQDLELKEIRDRKTREWGNLLLCSQYGWFRAGNVAETLSQVCQVLTPILAGCAAGFKDENLSLTAMVFGACGIGLNRFASYAHKESAERGLAANEFLLAQGVRAIPIIKDNSSSPA